MPFEIFGGSAKVATGTAHAIAHSKILIMVSVLVTWQRCANAIARRNHNASGIAIACTARRGAGDGPRLGNP
jgi:hypothetical protein